MSRNLIVGLIDRLGTSVFKLLGRSSLRMRTVALIAVVLSYVFSPDARMIRIRAGMACWAALLGFGAGVVSLPSLAAVTNPDGIAVIIGNRGYGGDIPDVEFAHNDADAMRALVCVVFGLR